MDLEKQAEIRRYKEAKEREVNKMIEKQELAISRVDNTEELRVQKAFEDAEKNMKIYDALMDLDDVDQVEHNMSN